MNEMREEGVILHRKQDKTAGQEDKETISYATIQSLTTECCLPFVLSFGTLCENVRLGSSPYQRLDLDATAFRTQH